jgi:hypothetical protein
VSDTETRTVRRRLKRQVKSTLSSEGEASRGGITRDRQARFALIKRWDLSPPVVTPELANTRIGAKPLLIAEADPPFPKTGRQFQFVSSTPASELD